MKHAYLTIDDSPSVDFLSKVRYLHKRDIPALIFCIGNKIEERFNEVVTAIQTGFIIGNHSYSHRHFSDLTLEEASREILKTDEIIEKLYKEAGTSRPAKYFRFPYFDSGGHNTGIEYEAHWSLPQERQHLFPMKAKKDRIQDFLYQHNYKQPNFQGINLKYFVDKSLLNGFDVRCTFDQAEYHLGSSQAPWGLSKEKAILSRIDEDFPYEGRSLNCTDTSDIVLVHDHEHTTEIFFKILDRYLEKGISFQLIE